jgi:hypothetical protein
VVLQLSDYQRKASDAVMAFWGNRDKALQKQAELGNADAGTRGAVTAGKNMDGFASLIADLVHGNGLTHARICLNKGLVVLPGYFRPTKQWDLLVLDGKRLIAAIELKSQVGSFGNNFNNRTEEAIGTAHDLWVAYREGALGDQSKPFVGWLMLVEDHLKSRSPVRDSAPHFPVFAEFQGASYLKRYDLLCQRLIKEQLYTSAAVLASPRAAASDGAFTSLSELTSLTAFVTSFAGHIATEAALKAANAG